MRIQRETLIDVGVFVTVGLILALTTVFFIGREKSLFEQRYTLVAPFKDISGLRNGAVVQLSGLSIGYVSDVRFPKDKSSSTLEVILKVAKKERDRIRKDSVARIHTQGLLGDKYIFITTGTDGFPPLENGDYIQTEELPSLQNLTETGHKTMIEIQEAAHEISHTLSTLELDKGDRDKIKRSLANMETITADLKAISEKVKNGEGTIGALIMDPSLYNDMRALLGHANRNKLFKNLIRATIDEQDKTTSMPVKNSP